VKPKVILYDAISLDGRTTGFPVDLGLFYSLVGEWKEDATLAGCDTLLQAPVDAPEETDTGLPDPVPVAGDTRPILAVTDSRGRLKNWPFLKAQPYWKDHVTLCTTDTPAEHIEYLKRHHIKTLIAGSGKVDLGLALEALNEQFGVTVVRVESGGTLNGVLLRSGLVDELHLLVHPLLAGGVDQKTFFHDSIKGGGYEIPLRLMEVRKMEQDLLLLSYRVLS
jgi:2,5-diamino-6-(ribosylamino)-4(3H)-pyrimidinone 5'-phosphate reductase